MSLRSAAAISAPTERLSLDRVLATGLQRSIGVLPGKQGNRSSVVQPRRAPRPNASSQYRIKIVAIFVHEGGIAPNILFTLTRNHPFASASITFQTHTDATYDAPMSAWVRVLGHSEGTRMRVLGDNPDAYGEQRLTLQSSSKGAAFMAIANYTNAIIHALSPHFELRLVRQISPTIDTPGQFGAEYDVVEDRVPMGAPISGLM